MKKTWNLVLILGLCLHFSGAAISAEQVQRSTAATLNHHACPQVSTALAIPFRACYVQDFKVAPLMAQVSTVVKLLNPQETEAPSTEVQLQKSPKLGAMCSNQEIKLLSEALVWISQRLWQLLNRLEAPVGSEVQLLKQRGIDLVRHLRNLVVYTGTSPASGMQLMTFNKQVDLLDSGFNRTLTTLQTERPLRNNGNVESIHDSIRAQKNYHLRLDSRFRTTIQESYPPCLNASNLVETDRLNETLSLANTSQFGEPAIFSAILDAILTPSPLICTQDYVRLAYKVVEKDRSSSSSSSKTKREWAALKARFRPQVFELFESREWKIMSVDKSGYGLFATGQEVPGVPRYAVVVMRPTSSAGTMEAFRFTLAAQADGTHFLVKSVLTGTAFQLYHLCRTGECNEADSQLILLPTEDFVLGNTEDVSAPLQFRLIQASDGDTVEVGTNSYWAFTTDFTGHYFGVSLAETYTVPRPETLLYLS